MSQLRRIVMVRHGETVGNSSVRFHGRGDPALSEEGIGHMRQAGLALLGECFDAVVASPLQRSWESARILAGGAPVQIEGDFREVDFGRWEGLTAEEIEAVDPVLYQEWRKMEPDFRFPEGESRAELQERVLCGLARLQESSASSALLALHKGPIRIIAARLLGEALPPEVPELGGEVSLTRIADGTWILGRRSSNPLHP